MKINSLPRDGGGKLRAGGWRGGAKWKEKRTPRLGKQQRLPKGFPPAQQRGSTQQTALGNRTIRMSRTLGADQLSRDNSLLGVKVSRR